MNETFSKCWKLKGYGGGSGRGIAISHGNAVDRATQRRTVRFDIQEASRRTNTQALIVIFLDEVPENEMSVHSSRSSRRQELSSQERTEEISSFLFKLVTTTNPFFASLSSDSRTEILSENRKEEILRQTVLDRVAVGSAAAVSTSVSVGYVVWLLRSGSLFTTFLSSMPAWLAFDPLPILDSFEGTNAGDDESLASLVSGEQ